MISKRIKYYVSAELTELVTAARPQAARKNVSSIYQSEVAISLSQSCIALAAKSNM